MPVTSAPRTDQVPLLARQAAAEFIGSALLAATVVGSVSPRNACPRRT